jgi:hypothetical protein
VCRAKEDLQGILNVLLNNVSLSVQGQDFKSGTKGIEQDGKEEGSSSRSECIGRFGCDDERCS